MPGDGSIIVDDREYKLLLKELQNLEGKMIEPVKKGLLAAAIVVQNQARKNAPVDRGELRNKILATGKIEQGTRSMTTAVESNAPHAAYVEFGTGIYGPKQARIYPKRARFLAWTGKDGKEYVRRSIAGMKARPYLAPAGFGTGREQLAAYQKSFDEFKAKLTKR